MFSDNIDGDHIEHALCPPDLRAETPQIRHPKKEEDQHCDKREDAEHHDLHAGCRRDIADEIPQQIVLDLLH